MATSINTIFAGDALSEMLRRVITGNQMVEGGHIAVHNNIQKTRAIPKITASNLIQDQAPTPTTQGTVTVAEATLTPADFMVYVEMNPRLFEAFWPEFQSNTELLMREFSPQARQAILNVILDQVSNYMGTAILQGDTGGAAPYDKFNGIATRLKADASVLDVAGAVAITDSSEAKAAIQAVYDQTPAEVRNMPNYKIFCSDATGELYKDAEITQSGKGRSFTDDVPLTYKGKRVVPLVGLGNNDVFGTYAGPDILNSNLHVGIDWQYNTTFDVIQLERLQANSEVFFAKMLMKADTQVVFGDQVVLYSV